MSHEKSEKGDDVDARLAAARKAKEERSSAKAKAAELLELEELELEAKFEAELGARGKAFFILQTTHGPIVVKRGESVVYKRFQKDASIKDGPSEKALLDFITPCVVHPDKEKFLEIVTSLKGLPLRLANPLTDLYSGKEVDEAGK